MTDINVINDAIMFTDEQLVKIATSSKDDNELTQAIAFALVKHDELVQMPRSQHNNQRRKFYVYTFGRLQKRMQWVTKRNAALAAAKRLRRYTTKAQEEVALKSLVSRLITAKANANARTQQFVDVVTNPQQPIVTGDKVADDALNNLREMALTQMANGEPVNFNAISDVYKAINTRKEMDILSAFKPDEKGEIEL